MLFLLLFSLLPFAYGGSVKSFLLIARTAPLSPDDAPLMALAFNNQVPGPLIRVNLDDMVHVKVENQMQDRITSIHWHGIFQLGTPYMDGVFGVTQCAINPGQYFTYKFKVNENPGTYWYHSHVGSQYVDGLAGPLIVDDPNDPFLSYYQGEHIMFLSEAVYETSDNGMYQFAQFNPYARNQYARSVLINGKGVCPRCTQRADDFPVFEVEPGKNYRFRVINGAAQTSMRIHIDQHPLTIIEADGSYLKPATFKMPSIEIGQRYSMLLNATQPPGDYLISVYSQDHSGGLNPFSNDYFEYQYAILRYKTGPSAAGSSCDGVPAVIPPSWALLMPSEDQGLEITPKMTSRLRMLHQPAPLPAPDVTLFYNISACTACNAFLVNNVSFALPSGSPFLHQMYSSKFSKPAPAAAAISNSTRSSPIPMVPDTRDDWLRRQAAWLQSKFPSLRSAVHKQFQTQSQHAAAAVRGKKRSPDPNRQAGAPFPSWMAPRGPNKFSVPVNKQIRIIIQNYMDPDATPHPIHLHGYKFHVIGVGDGPFSYGKPGAPPAGAGAVPLITRDTVWAYNNQFTVLQFESNNPGAWYMHCHIEYHLTVMGLGMVLEVGTEKDLPPLPKNTIFCPNSD